MRTPIITLHQPWASWIAWGLKTIETRTHNRFKSLCFKEKRFGIHAGQTFDHSAFEQARLFTSDKEIPDLKPKEYPRGVILCTVVAPWAFSPSSRYVSQNNLDAAMCNVQGMFCLWLRDLRLLDPPVPAKGHQGIWYFELEIEGKV